MDDSTPHEPHRRRSIRLKNYDYSQAGAYFVTICTRDKESVFGRVADRAMQLNQAGGAVWQTWLDLPQRFPTVALDEFIVMPNHVHGIIVIASVRALIALPKEGAASGAPTLAAVVRAFKSISAIAVNRAVSRPGVTLWQRNYYEHVVRGEDDLNAIRAYISGNPMLWAKDEYNPDRKGHET